MSLKEMTQNHTRHRFNCNLLEKPAQQTSSKVIHHIAPKRPASIRRSLTEAITPGERNRIGDGEHQGNGWNRISL